MNRGYFGIGVYRPKTADNIGTLWRSAYIFGAALVFTIGHRYKWQPTDTLRAYRHLQFYEYSNEDSFILPKDCMLVGIEITDKAKEIRTFNHPERAIYILGPEDGNLPESIINQCTSIIKIPGKHCLNVATAGSIVMYDRITKEKE